MKTDSVLNEFRCNNLNKITEIMEEKFKKIVHKYFIGFKYFRHFHTSKLRLVSHDISKTLVNIIQSQNGEEGDDKSSYYTNLLGDNVLHFL